MLLSVHVSAHSGGQMTDSLLLSGHSRSISNQGDSELVGNVEIMSAKPLHTTELFVQIIRSTSLEMGQI